MNTNEAKRVAFRHLNHRCRILAPAAEATVRFPAYDPCRAAQPIAIVEWPCTVANTLRESVAIHVICEGDSAY